ncbi:DUF262 domain-containing protein [Komagataeibacter kakiaceti]|uniref:DUF262 domain-containing protein n=1 Tax=Komagataeibacter kakiaceti TaxID=943261 RepID=UPI000A01D87A|nr:DUF262 domain-containing protein [Komagataeibacter kakiaceti]
MAGQKAIGLGSRVSTSSVWSPSAKVFLIDTILNDLPMPQVYFRTKLNPQSQTTLREVVDGQQRLRAILEFAGGNLKLTSKSPNFKGKTYRDLSIEDQEQFLAYRIPVVQLVNASDADVLEVFARLNSYSVKVTPAELRHAEFSEPVKWAIYEAARRWAVLWGELKVVSTRDTVRLKNTTLIAEMFITLDRGLGDGGEAQITRYYKENKSKDDDYFSLFREHLDEVIAEILDHTQNDFAESTFYDAPNFLILFAAVAFLKGYMPVSSLSAGVNQFARCGVSWDRASVNLATLAQAFDDASEEQGPLSQFVTATKSTTHRISSRKIRFETVVKAIAADVAGA